DRSRSIKLTVLGTIVATHQSGKGYKVISKQFDFQHSTLRKIIHKWKTFKTVANLDIPVNSLQEKNQGCNGPVKVHTSNAVGGP
uniref:Sleeping Beauty transposase HTH domain-containing protein n=1 Tax=Lates calcarifer TaxID=8187 RepID=A0A4W6C4Y9_LATCA